MDWSRLWTAVGGRKFIGFALACAFLMAGLISDTIWAVAFSVYVGGNVAQKALLASAWAGTYHLEGDDTK